MEAFALGMTVHYTASRICTTAVSEADYGLGAGVFVELYARAFKPSPAPDPSRCPGALGKSVARPLSHTATDLVLAVIDYS